MNEGFGDFRRGQVHDAAPLQDGRQNAQKPAAGQAAPGGMPTEIITRLAESVKKTIDNPEFQKLADQQFLPLRFLAPDAYRAELVALRTRYQALWNLHPWAE